jgi:hypothetical protein
MKTIILAAFAALSLSLGSAYAQSLPPSPTQETVSHHQGPAASSFDADWGNG